MLQSVLGVANQDQDASYPPYIFQSQFNSVTSLLLNALVKQYPDNPSIIDIISPFVKFCLLPVQNGYISLPEDYRNILGSPYIFANPKQNGECGSIPNITTVQEMQVAQNKGQCKVNPLYIVSQAEFSERTRSSFDYPTHEFPIGYFSSKEKGRQQIKICPYDLTRVALLYAKQEKSYVFTYLVNPDETYIFNPNDPNLSESEWESSAFTPIFNAMVSLYAAYVRDPELSNWAQILNQQGVL